MAIVSFYNHDIDPRLEDRRKLKPFLVELFKREKKQLTSLTYIFCTDDHLLQINKEFLKHDFFTDIITFDLREDPKDIIGEIYISVDRVKDNAKKLGTSYNDELHRVIFHGALHLCGYKDKTPGEVREMRNMEEFTLSRYFN